jgi:hypothetical protein
MANEINYFGFLSVAKGNLSERVDAVNLQADLAGSRRIRNTQIIGTTYEAIALGDLASVGFAMFRNLDTTNYVEIGGEQGANFVPVLRLNPGETAGPLRLASTSVFGRANTAAVNLDCTIFEA